MLQVDWKQVPKKVQLKATYTIAGKTDPNKVVKVEAIAKAGSFHQHIGLVEVKADSEGNFNCTLETHKIPNWINMQKVSFTDVTFVVSTGDESAMTQRRLEAQKG